MIVNISIEILVILRHYIQLGLKATATTHRKQYLTILLNIDLTILNVVTCSLKYTPEVNDHQL